MFNQDLAEELQVSNSRDYITEAYSALDPAHEALCDEQSNPSFVLWSDDYEQYEFEPNDLGDMVLVSYCNRHDQPWCELKSVDVARALYSKLRSQGFKKGLAE